MTTPPTPRPAPCRPGRPRAAAAGLALALLLAGPAVAQTTRTWTGAGLNTNWGNASNWDTGVPATGDVVVFSASTAPAASLSSFIAAAATFSVSQVAVNSSVAGPVTITSRSTVGGLRPA